MKQWNVIKEFFGKLSSNTKKGLLLVGGALIVVAVIIALVLNTNKQGSDQYVTLFSGLSDQEATEVMAKLQEDGVDYKYQQDGQVKVPSEVADQSRAALVVAGFPKNGFSYDTFLSHSNMMSTESDKKSLKIWDLQDRLAATIRWIGGVKEAVVQISPGETQKYVLDDTNVNIPTASVMVTMKDGGSPTPEQVSGIQRLVAKSVANMDMGDVAVIDGNGLDVSQLRNDTASPVSDAKMSFEERVQLQVESKVLHVLEGMFGRNNVRVSAKCTADMEKTVSEENGYTAPNVQNNSGYITDQSLSSDSTGGTGTGGVPGAQANTNIPQYNTQAGNTQNNSSATSDTTFALNSIKTQTQNDAAKIADLSVAVSINTESGTLGIDKAELTSLVGNAAGIDAVAQPNKIVIVSSTWPKIGVVVDGPGPDEPVIGPGLVIKPEYIKYLIGAGVLFVLLLIAIILLVGRAKRKARAELENMMVSEPADEKAGLAELGKLKIAPVSVEDEKSREMKENIRGFAEDNPEISAQLLKSWLRGDEDHG